MDDDGFKSQCPREVAEPILQIIRTAILSIRMAGYFGDVAYCTLEADHIHNLPGLITNYSHDNLSYYYDAERPDYLEGLQKLRGTNALTYESQWQRIGQFLENEKP